MGYDTVLLLVDESVFGACDRYLARAPSHDDAVQEIATLLATDRHAGELALAEWLFVQASVKAPGLKARNVALSLWREEEMGVVFPRVWSGALEQHMPLLRSRYPELMLPRWFEGNFCTGVYVESRFVPEVLAFVEATVAKLEDGHARHFRNLVRVLQVAAERGLGYWEATEVPVAAQPAHAEWLADPDHDEMDDDAAAHADERDDRDAAHDSGEGDATLRIVDSPFGREIAMPIAREPDVWVVPAGERVLGFDAIAFPPEPTPWKARATLASYAPWGTDLSVVGGELVEHLDDGKTKTLAVPFPVGALRLVGEGVVALPITDAPTRSRPVRITKSWSGRKITPLPVPATTGGPTSIIPFADDSYLLVWDGRPYLGKGARVELLTGERLVPDDPISRAITMKDGSIVGVFGGGLLRIASDGTHTSIAGFVDPIELVRGGEDSVVVRERAGEPLLQVWWGATGETTRLTREDFALEDEPVFCYFADTDDVLVVVTARSAHALAWEQVATLPRRL